MCKVSGAIFPLFKTANTKASDEGGDPTDGAKRGLKVTTRVAKSSGGKWVKK